jgi:hypothetical protein
VGAQTEYEFDLRAEAQFEYYKILNDLEKKMSEKNPQTYDELKQIAKDYFFERADHLKNLKPEVKLELCNLLSETSDVLLGSPYPSGLCEAFASTNPAPHIPWEECKYVKDTSAGTSMQIVPKFGSSLILNAELSKAQLVLGDNQTVTGYVISSVSNGPHQNATVQVTMSDSSGRAIHSTKGKTDVNGSFSYSWTVNSQSPDSYYTVTVNAKNPVDPSWASGTLYFNRTPDQMPNMRICPWDNQSIPPS